MTSPTLSGRSPSGRAGHEPSLQAVSAVPVTIANAEYVIRKNGYFYRPHAAGYTLCADEAGRFTLEEAIRHSHPNGPDGPRDGITYSLAPAPSIFGKAGIAKAITEIETHVVGQRDEIGRLRTFLQTIMVNCERSPNLTKDDIHDLCVGALNGKTVNDCIAGARLPTPANAKAMEARRAETGTGSVHDSAAPQGFAQDTPEAPRKGNSDGI